MVSCMASWIHPVNKFPEALSKLKNLVLSYDSQIKSVNSQSSLHTSESAPNPSRPELYYCIQHTANRILPPFKQSSKAVNFLTQVKLLLNMPYILFKCSHGWTAVQYLESLHCSGTSKTIFTISTLISTPRCSQILFSKQTLCNQNIHSVE